MKLAIVELADKIEVQCGDRLRSMDLAQNIYPSLGTKKCPIIFDNVIEYDGLSGVKDYLPTGLPPTVKKPHILVTSRDSKLIKNKRLLKLDIFTLEDAEIGRAHV